MLTDLEPGKNHSIQECLAACWDDPLGFVMWAYPWGEGLLAGEEGPDAWQKEILVKTGEMAAVGEPVRIAVSSGHGPGKTALSSWLIHWFISTRSHPQGVVTANTRNQLVGKTWRELSKWHKMSMHRDMFEWTEGKFFLKSHPSTWFFQNISWNKDRAEAFAGTHEKHVMMIFDEASLVADEIWEVAEGAMTTPGAMWFVFGNPTRNQGRFFECWNRFEHRWTTFKVDSRTAKKADKRQLRQWVEDYGEDSDFVRVRVRGEFPRASFIQFISAEAVFAAQRRKYTKAMVAIAPIQVAADVARYGDDKSVICVRQGQAVLEIKKFRELDTISFGNILIGVINRYAPHQVCCDSVGIGAGVIDYLRSRGHMVLAVNAGSKSSQSDKYFNLRAEMWFKMREWLTDGQGSIPEDEDLFKDLVSPQYSYSSKDALMLEKKDEMKMRGIDSPDVGDALAMTFAFPAFGHVVDGDGFYAGQKLPEFDVLHFL